MTEEEKLTLTKDALLLESKYALEAFISFMQINYKLTVDLLWSTDIDSLSPEICKLLVPLVANIRSHFETREHIAALHKDISETTHSAPPKGVTLH